MKTFLRITLTLQLCLFAVGIYLLCQGEIFHGLFNIIVNAIFIPLVVKILIHEETNN